MNISSIAMSLTAIFHRHEHIDGTQQEQEAPRRTPIHDKTADDVKSEYKCQKLCAAAMVKRANILCMNFALAS